MDIFFSSDPKANPVGAMGGAGIGMHKKLVKVSRYTTYSGFDL